MKLHVVMYQDNKQVDGIPDEIQAPDDHEKVAKFVAREVKRWIKQVPITANGSRIRFDVNAYFTFDHERSKPRKKKAAKEKAK